MFFIFALMACLFYAFNNVFLAPITRGEDPLSVSSYRGLALAIIMIPFLFLFLSFDDLKNLSMIHILMMLFCCFMTSFGNVTYYIASRYLPVGIASALCLAFSTIFVTLLGYFVNNDRIGLYQFLLSMGIVGTVVMIAVASKSVNFDNLDIKRGMLYSLLFGVFLGTGYFIVGQVSNEVNPVLVAYLWETGIGIIGLLTIHFKSLATKSKFVFDFSKLRKIAIAASPTVIGTTCYAYSTTTGSISLVAAIMPLISVFTAILGVFFLNEKLKTSQWILIILLILLLVGFKLVS